MSSFCKKYAAPILLLISINLIVFSNKVSGQFLSDDFYILAQIEDFVFSFKNLIEFGISKPISIYFRPVVMVMWLLLHKAFGQAPLYYHAVLLAFHIANALLVYFLLKRVVGKEAGYASALIFSVLTGNLEAVQWLSCFFDVVCAHFFLASLLLWVVFLEQKKFLYYFASLVFAALSVLSKEPGITLPVIALALPLLFPLANSARFKSRLSWLWFGFPYWIMCFGYMLVRSKILLRYGVQTTPLFSVFQSKIWSGYATVFGKLIWAEGRTATPPVSMASGALLIAIGVFIVLALMFAYFKKDSRKAIALGLGWIFITSTPATMFLLHFHERYNYLPSVGFCLILGRMLTAIPGSVRGKRLAPLFCGAVVALYSINTISHNRMWTKAWGVSREIQERFKNDVGPVIKKPAKVFFFGIPDFVDGVGLFVTGFSECFSLLTEEEGYRFSKAGATPYVASPEDSIFENEKYGYYWFAWDSSMGRFRQIRKALRGDGSFAPDKNTLAVWDFSGRDGLGPWEPVSGLEVLSGGGAGARSFRVTGNRSLLASPPINRKVKYIQITCATKNQIMGPIFGRALWTTSGESPFDDTQSVAFPVRNDGLRHTYTLPLFLDPRTAKAPLARLGLMLSNRPGTLVEIESITLYSYHPIEPL